MAELARLDREQQFHPPQRAAGRDNTAYPGTGDRGFEANPSSAESVANAS